MLIVMRKELLYDICALEIVDLLSAGRLARVVGDFCFGLSSVVYCHPRSWFCCFLSASLSLLIPSPTRTIQPSTPRRYGRPADVIARIFSHRCVRRFPLLFPFRFQNNRKLFRNALVSTIFSLHPSASLIDSSYSYRCSTAFR